MIMAMIMTMAMTKTWLCYGYTMVLQSNRRKEAFYDLTVAAVGRGVRLGIRVNESKSEDKCRDKGKGKDKGKEKDKGKRERLFTDACMNFESSLTDAPGATWKMYKSCERWKKETKQEEYRDFMYFQYKIFL